MRRQPVALQTARRKSIPDPHPGAAGREGERKRGRGNELGQAHRDLATVDEQHVRGNSSGRSTGQYSMQGGPELGLPRCTVQSVQSSGHGSPGPAGPGSDGPGGTGQALHLL
eukprot:12087906-Alexandrium_andersonii.AAC.1